MDESADVKLARVEESLKFLHKKTDSYLTIAEKNAQDIEILKRDRWWAFTLVGVSFSILLAYINLLKI